MSPHYDYKEVAARLVSNFNMNVDSEEGRKQFLSSYHPDIQWFDHTFHIQRVGHDAVVGLSKTMNHCNQPFLSTVKAAYPISTGMVLEVVWRGTCKNDIFRPDGEVVFVGTGKEFEAHVCMILQLDDAGKITRIDEYYNKRWDLGTGEDSYRIIDHGNVRVP